MKNGTFVNRFVRNRFFQHLVFWCLSITVLVFLMKVSADVKFIDLVYVLVFHVVILPTVYLNLLILVPRLMAKNRYVLYLLALIINLALGIGFYYLVFNIIVDWVLSGYYFVAVYSVFEIGLILLTYIVLTLLFKLARAWFFVSKIEEESTRHQLEALKSKVNPHFLFNTLSSIYSLARKNSEMAPVVILQLSDIMRYMLYETECEKVALIKELEIINNILEIHQIRFGEKLTIEKKIEGDIREVQVPPLLFIPFIENVMKHCRTSPNGNFFINMNFGVDGDKILFAIENSFDGNTHVIESGGIGLENVGKRLALLYPKKHYLTIDKKENIFRVELFLNLS
ncbi:MAG TPA: histidine kinase [Prolixibacteraceae bacterium]|nr:histidine kinase [Prolixibacteraceae bacterium]